MSDQNIARGILPPGGETPRRPDQQFPLLQKWFTSDQQAVPIRVVYGHDFVAGTQMTPIFGFRAVAVKTKLGK
jgi:hypothetical protein